MAVDAELPGDDAKAEAAAKSVKQQAATAKAKKARRKKVRGCCLYVGLSPCSRSQMGAMASTLRHQRVSSRPYERVAVATKPSSSVTLVTTPALRETICRQAPRKSAVLFEATRDVAATIAEAEPQAQADWLWDNYAEHTGAAPLERGDFGGALAAHNPRPCTSWCDEHRAGSEARRPQLAGSHTCVMRRQALGWLPVHRCCAALQRVCAPAPPTRSPKPSAVLHAVPGTSGAGLA